MSMLINRSDIERQFDAAYGLQKGAGKRVLSRQEIKMAAEYLEQAKAIVAELRWQRRWKQIEEDLLWQS